MTDTSMRPSYAQLPILAGQERHSWDFYGRDDELGTLNELTPDVVRAAAAHIVSGERVNVQLPPDLPDPPMFGRSQMHRESLQTGRNNWDDRIDSFFPQGSTQWDGFRHVRFREHGFYGGVTEDPPAMGQRLSVHHWAVSGIVGRGVLLDVAGHWAATARAFDPFGGESISLDDIREVADAQGVALQRGDLLCIRTGWADRYKQSDHAERARVADPQHPRSFVGLSSAVDLVEMLWDAGVAALAVDNPAVEWAPGDAAEGSLHRRLLAQLGMPLGELFDFDDLARRCRADGRWTFFLSSVPLGIVGGAGTPANAVAIR